MTIRAKRVGRIQRTELSGYGESPAEAAVARLFAPYSATGQAMFVNPAASCWRGAGPSDPPFPAAAEEDRYSGGFIGLDRAGGRRWTIGASGRHPVLSALAGRPAIAFGRDGSGLNAMTAQTNGDIVAGSLVDAFGVEVSARPLFQAGTGYSIFAKFSSAPTSGVILGSAAIGNDAFVFGLHPDTGELVIRNRIGSPGLSYDRNFRGGSTQSVIATYDAATGQARVWYRDVAGDDQWKAEPPFAGMVDVIGTGAAALPKIGGYGAAVSGWPFDGYVFALGYLPSPILNDAIKRADVIALLDAQ